MFPGILVPIAIFFGFCVIMANALSAQAIDNIKR